MRRRDVPAAGVLDAIGTVPKPAEAAAFLDSTDPDKRRELVDRLLGLTGDPTQDIYNDAYAAYWTRKMVGYAPLLDGQSWRAGHVGHAQLDPGLRSRQNKPLDGFARELLTAKGSVFLNGAANFFRVAAATGPTDLAETTAKVFLGVRLQCAKCHNHPYENYTQSDYYRLAAFSPAWEAR